MHEINDAIDAIAKGWADSGVSAGDTLLVHSNIKRTLVKIRNQGIPLMPEHVLESFMRALGDQGTLILPLFNFDFPRTKFFDLRNTPSQMGALTEIGRLKKAAVRTGHPIYSFAVLGDKAEQFSGLDNQSGYGDDSPFAMLKALDGKIASLDLEDQNSMTFYHFVEEMNQVDYRYFKTFCGTYIDASGATSEKSYRLFVRDLEKKVVTHVNPAGELMWEAGLYRGDRPGVGSGLRTIRATQMYDFVSALITQGKAEGLLFSYDE